MDDDPDRSDRTDHIDKVLRIIDGVFGPDDGGPVPPHVLAYEEILAPFSFHPYYDRQGRPLGQEEAVRLLSDADARRVALDHIGDLTVSTVHLVMNHQYDEGPPLIFETMIHDDAAGEWRDEAWRYATEEEAAEGHRRVVAWLRGEGEEP